MSERSGKRPPRDPRPPARAGLTAEAVTGRFRGSLPPETHGMLKTIGGLARDLGANAYLVGGIVRDIAIGHPVTDLDITVEGSAEAVARGFARIAGGTFKARTEFGTCKVETGTFGTIDFAATRRETYRRPGALPDTEPSEILSDLERRDFTLNAMAIHLGPSTYGRLLDPCGGLPDLSQGRLRVMHPRSFLDDPTRVLRGVRFAARYGFTFERGTRRLLVECLEQGGLASISGKRLYRELQLVSAEERSAGGLILLEKYAILERALGAGGDRPGRRLLWRRLPAARREVEAAVGGAALERWVPWFASLFLGLGARRAALAAAHLNLPRDVRQACLFVAGDCRRVLGRLATMNRARAYEVTALLKPISTAGLSDLYALAPRASRALILAYLTTWRHVKPSLTGADLAAMGLGEGPLVGKLLASITRLKLAGRLSSRQAEVVYAQARIARCKRR